MRLKLPFRICNKSGRRLIMATRLTQFVEAINVAIAATLIPLIPTTSSQFTSWLSRLECW